MQANQAYPAPLATPWPGWRALAAVGLLAALAAAGGFWWAVRQPLRQVEIRGWGDQPLVVHVRGRTVAAALAEAGVLLGPGDQVTPAPGTELGRTAVIQVVPAHTVLVRADGQIHSVRTTARRVSDVLAAAGVAVGPDDRVEPGLAAPVGEGTVVRVVRVRHELATREEEVPFETIRREDPNLEIGQTRLLQAGLTGRKAITERRTYEDGALVATQVVEEKLVEPPMPQIVAFGTVGVVARGGQVYRYRQRLTMVATGYSPGDGQTPDQYTATGALARRGVVAVDPRVIPLGTRLYIEGYGPAVAADTGGAIKGNRIDLCFDTPQEAWAYGVKEVTVYILTN